MESDFYDMTTKTKTNVRIIKKQSKETPELVKYNEIQGDTWIKYLTEYLRRKQMATKESLRI